MEYRNRNAQRKAVVRMGVQSTKYDLNFFLKSGRVLGTAVNHPHNHFLNIAYHRGLVSLVLFVILIFLVMAEIDRIENRQIKAIYFATSVTIFMAALIDTLDFSMFYFLIPLVAYTRKWYEDKNIIKKFLQYLEWRENG